MDFVNLISLLAYLMLAINYIYAYFKPKTHSSWLLLTSFGNMFQLLATAFLLSFLSTSIYLIAFPIVWVFAFISYSIFKRAGGSLPWFSFLIYLFSIFFDSATIKITNYQSFFFSLPFYYLFSFFVLWFISSFFSKILDKNFPQLKEEHIKIMKEKFNFVPKQLYFSINNMTFLEGAEAPAICTFMGLLYCLFMILRQFIF